MVNYTERLNLKMLDWVQQTYQTDTNKVYAYGASMGTGVQRLVTQNPDRFACVDLLVPLIDWSYVDGVEDNAKRLEACCGAMSMPTSDGVTLGERVNLVNFMQNTTRDLPHAIIRVGRTDGSVYWAQKPPYMAAMQANRHGLIAGCGLSPERICSLHYLASGWTALFDSAGTSSLGTPKKKARVRMKSSSLISPEEKSDAMHRLFD